MSEVNRERVALGVAALRSGEYQQCQKVLHKAVVRLDEFTAPVKAYCCLGVLTEVAIANGLEGLTDTANGWIWLEEGGPVATSSQLPEPVRQWYGFDRNNPTITSDGVVAAEANDDLGWDFDQIADEFEGFYLPEPVEGGVR